MEESAPVYVKIFFRTALLFENRQSMGLKRSNSLTFLFR